MEKPKLLAIFAHPDDEVFRCGGTLALLAQGGAGVHVLTFTRGQAGSRGEPPLCVPEELGAVRARELVCSCRRLGLEPPEILEYEDRKLARVSMEEGAAQIMTRIQTIHPQVLLTWPADGLSGHPDHIAVSRWTMTAYHQAKKEGNDELAALYHLAVPDSLARELGMNQLRTLPDHEVTVTVNVERIWEQKMAAIACHRTQAGESPILQAPLERQKRFLGWEYFRRAQACKPEDMVLKLNQFLKESSKQ